MTDVFSAVRLSLCVSVVSTALCACLGIPLGCALAMRRFRGRRLLLNLLNTLMSIPTVVIGLLVYTLVCRQSPLGFLDLLFTPSAIVIGQVLLALPIMVVLSHTAIDAVDPAAAETAKTLGASRTAAAWVMISEGRAGILAAVAAVFGRLIGEVGVSMIVGGNIANYTRTITTAIALETSKGEVATSLQLGAILLSVSLGVNFLLQLLRAPSLRRREVRA